MREETTTLTKEQLWHEAYDNNRGAVRDTLLDYEHDYDLIDDLTHDTFMEAWDHLSGWDGKSEFVTWLCGIAKNVGRRHVEKVTAQKRQGEVLECYIEHEADAEGYATPYYDRTDLSGEVQGTSEHLDPYYEVEARHAYGTALLQMPARMASVVQLRAQGHGNAEIAEILGTSVGYVENLISRAKNFFAECENSPRNRTNSVYERDGEPSLEGRRLSQSDVERVGRKRFDRRNSAFTKRRARLANPDATLAEWKEAYDESG